MRANTESTRNNALASTININTIEINKTLPKYTLRPVESPLSHLEGQSPLTYSPLSSTHSHLFSTKPKPRLTILHPAIHHASPEYNMNEHFSRNKMSSSNQFAVLGYVRDEIFKGLDSYLTSDELGPMMGTFKWYMMDNETP